jgi:AraC-like DNA-binding protein
MIYRIFHPIPILSDVVEHYWYSKVELNGSLVQHYATPLLQGLTFNFRKLKEQHTYNGKLYELDKQAYIFGQSVSSRMVSTHESGIDILGVKFKPLGISKVTGINMEHLADQIIAAEDIWGNEIELLCDSMQSAVTLEQTLSVLEDFLIDKYLHTNLHYRVDSAKHAVQLINQSKGNISIKTLQEETNISRKTLERSFIHYLGIQPKLYTRIVRFNAVKELLDNTNRTNITPLALDCGFYDSSHFISEFKAFAGVTPTAYLKNR